MIIECVICFLIGYGTRGAIHIYAQKLRRFKAECRRKAWRSAEVKYRRATFDLNI